MTAEEVGKLLNVSRETLCQFEAYLTLLEKWQRRINLVSNSTMANVWQRHILDSAQLFRFCPPNTKKILDVGSGKGFLLHDLKQLNEQFEIAGIDISEYALEHAVDDVREHCVHGCASALPFEDNYFDLVISINTLHNLCQRDLWRALYEINRVGKAKKFICVESYRNIREKVNLLYWQLTCRSFFSVEDWEFIFTKTSYDGDYEFIFFE